MNLVRTEALCCPCSWHSSSTLTNFQEGWTASSSMSHSNPRRSLQKADPNAENMICAYLCHVLMLILRKLCLVQCIFKCFNLSSEADRKILSGPTAASSLTGSDYTDYCNLVGKWSNWRRSPSQVSAATSCKRLCSMAVSGLWQQLAKIWLQPS